MFRLLLHHDDVIRTARLILDDDLDYSLYEEEEIIAGESFQRVCGGSGGLMED